MTIMHDLKVKGYASYDKLKTCLVGRSYNRNQFSHIKNRKVKDKKITKQAKIKKSKEKQKPRNNIIKSKKNEYNILY